MSAREEKEKEAEAGDGGGGELSSEGRGQREAGKCPLCSRWVIIFNQCVVALP